MKYKTLLLTFLALAAFAVGLNRSICQAQQPAADVPGAQVLTRGPVHEAFAGMVTFNPEPGIVVVRPPPAIIEEMPPEQRPEGDNVTWIPGYWAWDDERTDFLWVSGTWRALPPGREWIAGYWGQTSQGYQWTSGYWAAAAAKETTYLPAPPATVEVGPNIAAPSDDYGWTPGCWVWYSGRYAWTPGYWAQGREDWDWMPAHYIWTPRGYIFVRGYWDYSVERRGVIFAPVYFESSVYARRGYYYSPTIVIDLGMFNDHLFLRPRYSHYYFGDYYATTYYQDGFYASYSFQSGRHGYDPFYSHQRWEHRQDREWEHRVETSYQYRRDNETARPPHTWAEQRNLNPGAPESKQNHVLVAMSIDQLAKRKDSPLRFQPVAKDERQKLVQRGQEVQKSRDQRQTLEAKAVDTSSRKLGAVIAPIKVQLPKSPIVAKPANQLGRNQAPPQAQRAPKPDAKFQPKPDTSSRPPSVDRSNPQAQPRKPESEQKPAPGRTQVVPLERPGQPILERQTEKPKPQAQAEPQRNVNGLENKTQPKPEPRAQDEVVKTPEEPPPNPGALEKKAQRQPQQSNKYKPTPNEKGATQLLRKENKKQGEELQPPREKPQASLGFPE